MGKLKRNEAITLVALVVTIVVLLILAGITITYIMGDNSIFKKAQDAKFQTEIAKAREKLEIVLTTVQIEKRTNSQYNENEFLDEYILNNLKDVEIIGDIIIVDGYAFEIDRSVPKIGEYVGRKEDLIFPEISISEIEYSSDYKSAKFTITTREDKNGINKIEIIQYGKVLDTFEYDNNKEEIIKEYSVKQNGVYTVKVYSKLSNNAKTEVKEIVMAVEYSPNGDIVYKREHSTKVTIKENTDRVKSLKYQWSKELTMPEESTFTQTCSNNSIVAGKDITGIYYLWTLLETESGKKNIGRSEGFHFDNEGPEVSITSTPVSETSFILTVTATDELSEIEKYEFYVDDKLVNEQKTADETSSYTWNGTEMAEKQCYVIVTDKAGNTTRKNVEARTKMHTWNKFEKIIEYKYVSGDPVPDSFGERTIDGDSDDKISAYSSRPRLDSETGFYQWDGMTESSRPKIWLATGGIYVFKTGNNNSYKIWRGLRTETNSSGSKKIYYIIDTITSIKKAFPKKGDFLEKIRKIELKEENYETDDAYYEYIGIE